MRRWILLLIGLFSGWLSFAVTTSSLQQLFFNAQHDAGIRSFYSAVQQVNEDQALQLAYKGVATAMYAGVASSVGDKLSYFKAGKKLLENAVQKDPGLAEIRFLRLAVQVKAPGILGYSGNIRSDADFIINALTTGRAALRDNFWQQAVSFMMKNKGALTVAQQQRLQKMQ